MTKSAELLRSTRCIFKLLEICELDVCRTHRLSLTEVDILAFLDNNPGLDTATDIVELRMIPKANVSQAVDALIRKALLSRQQDTKDRRRIHLALTPAAQPIVQALRQARHQFVAQLFSGFTNEEQEAFFEMSRHIVKNASAALEERGQRHVGKQ
jgi:DNA-binding MarR family transcriptional regulator